MCRAARTRALEVACHARGRAAFRRVEHDPLDRRQGPPARRAGGRVVLPCAQRPCRVGHRPARQPFHARIVGCARRQPRPTCRGAARARSLPRALEGRSPSGKPKRARDEWARLESNVPANRPFAGVGGGSSTDLHESHGSGARPRERDRPVDLAVVGQRVRSGRRRRASSRPATRRPRRASHRARFVELDLAGRSLERARVSWRSPRPERRRVGKPSECGSIFLNASSTRSTNPS